VSISFEETIFDIILIKKNQLIQGDCGDYVVVINSKHISLKDDLWRTFNFFHHTRQVFRLKK